MVRAFLTLYGALGLALVFFLASVIWLPQLLLHDVLDRYYARATSGAFALVEEQLPVGDVARWPAIIAAMSAHFPQGIALHTVEHLDLSNAELRRIENDRQVFRSEGARKIFFRRMHGSRYVLELAIGPTLEQEAAAEAEGLLWLVETSFLAQSEEAWPSVLSRLREHFDMPLALVPIDKLVLSSEQRRALEGGAIVVEGVESDTDTYLKRLGDSAQVFRAGPLVPPVVLRSLNGLLLVVLASIVAMTVMAWIRPFWRDLMRLDAGVRAFGNGQLETRLPVRAGSPLVNLNTTFNAMAERIQALLRSHRELTSAVSHELRTPLARLRFRLDLLEEPAGDEQRLLQLHGMRKDLLELEDLVSESLTYARLDREHPEVQLRSLDLQQWLEELIDEVRPDFEGLTLSCSPLTGPSVFMAFIDTRQMTRAVNNLLRNARRHARSEVRVAIERSGLSARILVEDDGTGVPVGERERIFEPFARLDAARDRDSGGVGLGLAIVSRIAQWHGGRAWVEESILGGARFVIDWPASAN